AFFQPYRYLLDHLPFYPTAGNHDGALLRKLEELDGRHLPTGRRLVAELGGVPVAAIAVADDTVVADPFARTTAVVDLLRVRARQLRLAS
ncbi:MAG: hypothetical protein WKF96_12030, partial [Solirubrobacteraceae bacterium]